MHVKITTSGPRRYVQLVESFRDEEGRIRKRTVAALGRLDQVGDSLDAVINGLLKATGRQPIVGTVFMQPPSLVGRLLSSRGAQGSVNDKDQSNSDLFPKISRQISKRLHKLKPIS